MVTKQSKRRRIDRVLAIVALSWITVAVAAFWLAPTAIFVLLAYLIIPWLIIGIAPTIALWSLTIWLFNELIRFVKPTRWSPLFALLATIAIMTAIPAYKNKWGSHPYYAMASERDILPSTRLTLSGDIMLLGPQLHDRNWRSGKSMTSEEYDTLVPWSCNALCIATLATAGVNSVTVDEGGRNRNAGFSSNARTFRLLPKRNCPAITATPDFEHGVDNEEWKLRLSTKECLIAERPRPDADFVVEIRKPQISDYEANAAIESAWAFDPLPASVDRLEIRDASDRLLFRKSIIRGYAYFVPLAVGLEMEMRGPTYFHWARSSLANAGPYDEIQPSQLLPQYTNLGEFSNL
jgi:hypothetical protein